MFHKIKNVSALPEYRLSVQFAEGCTKIYDMKPLFERIPLFAELKDSHLFFDLTVDVGGHGVVWNDDLDLSCDELWENGVEVETPFDGLMAFSDPMGFERKHAQEGNHLRQACGRCRCVQVWQTVGRFHESYAQRVRRTESLNVE